MNTNDEHQRKLLLKDGSLPEKSQSFENQHNIVNVSEMFERWIRGPRSKFLPSYVLALIGTPTRDLYNGALSVPYRRTTKSTVSDVIEAI